MFAFDDEPKIKFLASVSVGACEIKFNVDPSHISKHEHQVRLTSKTS